MNEYLRTYLSVMVILVSVTIAVSYASFYDGIRRGETDMKIEAVKRGYGEWTNSVTGTPEFKWKVVE